MSDRHQVISAFIDDEPFDPHELATALADPSGRTLLIDLVALRHIVQPAEQTPAGGSTRKVGTRVRVLSVAAALCLALGGGYFIGRGQTDPPTSEAPAPTRVVQGPSEWQPPSTRSAQ